MKFVINKTKQMSVTSYSSKKTAKCSFHVTAFPQIPISVTPISFLQYGGWTGSYKHPPPTLSPVRCPLPLFTQVYTLPDDGGGCKQVLLRCPQTRRPFNLWARCSRNISLHHRVSVFKAIHKIHRSSIEDMHWVRFEKRFQTAWKWKGFVARIHTLLKWPA